MSESLINSLDHFVDDYQRLYQSQKKELIIQYDPDWLSPCYMAEGEQDQWVNWRPLLRAPQGVFTDLEQALDIKIDGQLTTFYGRYWSDNLDAQTDRGTLQLLQAWNHDDFIRLQQNLVAHVLMKRRLKQADTLFFALTDEDDFMICIDNQTGEVVLEQVGLEPQEILAKDLASFIGSLKPLCR